MIKIQTLDYEQSVKLIDLYFELLYSKPSIVHNLHHTMGFDRLAIAGRPQGAYFPVDNFKYGDFMKNDIQNFLIQCYDGESDGIRCHPQPFIDFKIEEKLFRLLDVIEI